MQIHKNSASSTSHFILLSKEEADCMMDLAYADLESIVEEKTCGDYVGHRGVSKKAANWPGVKKLDKRYFPSAKKLGDNFDQVTREMAKTLCAVMRVVAPGCLKGGVVAETRAGIVCDLGCKDQVRKLYEQLF